LYCTASGIVTHCRWPSGAQVERGQVAVRCTGWERAGGRPVHRLGEGRWPSGAQVGRVLQSGAQVERGLQSSLNLRTGQPPTVCDDTRCCIIQFVLLLMSTTVLETCRGI